MFIMDPTDSFFNMVSRKIEFEKIFLTTLLGPLQRPSEALLAGFPLKMLQKAI